MSRTDDLTTQEIDIWAIKGIQMTVMAEEKFNYRYVKKVIGKCLKKNFFLE